MNNTKLVKYMRHKIIYGCFEHSHEPNKLSPEQFIFFKMLNSRIGSFIESVKKKYDSKNLDINIASHKP